MLLDSVLEMVIVATAELRLTGGNLADNGQNKPAIRLSFGNLRL